MNVLAHSAAESDQSTAFTAIDNYGFSGGRLEHVAAIHEYVREESEQRKQVIERMRVAIKVSLEEYESWDEKRKKAFDKERKSLLTTEVPIRTSHLDRTVEVVMELHELAELRQRDQAGGVLIAGRAGVGKTTALVETMLTLATKVFDQLFEDKPWWLMPASELTRISTSKYGDRVEAQLIPVVPVIMPTSITPKAISEAILKSIAYYTGEFESLGKFGREIDLTDTLVERLRMHGTRAIFIDEAHFITDDKKGLFAINHIKSIMNKARVLIVAAGVMDAFGSALALLEGREREATKAQLRARFLLMEFEPFIGSRSARGVGIDEYDEWKRVLSAVGRRVILLKQDHAWWRNDDIVEYFWKRTDGVFVALVTFITNAGIKAIGKTEEFTIEFLESVEISLEADSKAAEEHQIGPKYRAARTKRVGRIARAARKNGDQRLAEKTVSGMQRSRAIRSDSQARKGE